MTPPPPFPPIDPEVLRVWAKEQKRREENQKKCPFCGSVLEDVWGTIGGFSGHDHIHPSSVVGFHCPECNRRFSLGEFLLLKEKGVQEKTRAKNYWKNICVIFSNPYLYLLAICIVLISGSFFAGIVGGIAVIFLMQLLTNLFSKLAERKTKASGNQSR